MTFRKHGIRLLSISMIAMAPVLLPPTTASAQLFDWGASDLFFDWGGSEQKVNDSGRQPVRINTDAKPGEIIVSFTDRKLYLITAPGQAISYPVAIPREQDRWEGKTTVSQKRENPSWTPTPDMIKENPRLPRWVPGGHPMNPLGNRALYLGTSFYRIHGTDAPWTIGTAVSKGCIRMYNKDALDVYDHTKVGAKVLVTWNSYQITPSDNVAQAPVVRDEAPSVRRASVSGQSAATGEHRATQTQRGPRKSRDATAEDQRTAAVSTEAAPANHGSKAKASTARARPVSTEAGASGERKAKAKPTAAPAQEQASAASAARPETAAKVPEAAEPSAVAASAAAPAEEPAAPVVASPSSTAGTD